MTWLGEQGDGLTNMKWEADKTQGLHRDYVPARVFELDSGREPLKYLNRNKINLHLYYADFTLAAEWLLDWKSYWEYRAQVNTSCSSLGEG